MVIWLGQSKTTWNVMCYDVFIVGLLCQLSSLSQSSSADESALEIWPPRHMLLLTSSDPPKWLCTNSWNPLLLFMDEIYGCWSHPDNGIIQWYLIGFWTVEWSIIYVSFMNMGSWAPACSLCSTWRWPILKAVSTCHPGTSQLTGPARVSQVDMNTYCEHISI